MIYSSCQPLICLSIHLSIHRNHLSTDDLSVIYLLFYCLLSSTYYLHIIYLYWSITLSIHFSISIFFLPIYLSPIYHLCLSMHSSSPIGCNSVERLSGMHRDSSYSTAYNLGTWELETGGSEVQDHLWLQTEFDQPGIHEILSQENKLFLVFIVLYIFLISLLNTRVTSKNIKKYLFKNQSLWQYHPEHTQSLLSIMHKHLTLVLCNPVFVSLATTSNSLITLYWTHGVLLSFITHIEWWVKKLLNCSICPY